MKMGTIASLWRYDAAAAKTILPDNQRWTTILRYALWAAVFLISLVVRLPFDSGPFHQPRDRRDGPIRDILLEVSAQFGLNSQNPWGTTCRRSNIPVVRRFHRWLLHSPVRWAAQFPQPQNQLPPARRKTAPVRFSPQQVQTPSFTAEKMAILFPTLRRRGSKATLGSQDTVSAHSPILIVSILHGSSSEL